MKPESIFNPFDETTPSIMTPVRCFFFQCSILFSFFWYILDRLGQNKPVRESIRYWIENHRLLHKGNQSLRTHKALCFESFYYQMAFLDLDGTFKSSVIHRCKPEIFTSLDNFRINVTGFIFNFS